MDKTSSFFKCLSWNYNFRQINRSTLHFSSVVRRVLKIYSVTMNLPTINEISRFNRNFTTQINLEKPNVKKIAKRLAIQLNMKVNFPL